jgi:hypothetical protein
MAATPSDCIDLVDEDQAGGVLARLLEHVADAARADTDKHFDKVRSADAEEGGIGLARDRLCEQRFARPGSADHQDPFGDAAAEFLELFRILQEFNQFGNLLLGLVHPGDILERGAVLFLAQEASFAFPEAQGTLSSHLYLADEKEVNQESDQQDREHRHKDAHEERVRLRFLKTAA